MTKYNRKDYVLSTKARELIKEIQKAPVRDGKVQLSGRTIDAMIKSGAIKKATDVKLPTDHSKGGFV